MTSPERQLSAVLGRHLCDLHTVKDSNADILGKQRMFVASWYSVYILRTWLCHRISVFSKTDHVAESRSPRNIRSRSKKGKNNEPRIIHRRNLIDVHTLCIRNRIPANLPAQGGLWLRESNPVMIAHEEASKPCCA